MIDLRRLLDRYRVEWKDRGPNTSKGNINIPCPFCKNDPSFHLGILELTGQYHCFRNPKHSGRNITYVLKLLGIPVHEYKELDLKQAERTEQKVTSDFSELLYFQPAENDSEAIEYLNSRLFSSPEEVCKKFKLRTQDEGRLAGRLIIPLTIGYTGRAMRSHIEPRYFTQGTEDSFFMHKQEASSCMLLEGALDAMKVASVTNQFDVIGKCGNRLSPALLSYLRGSRYLSIYNTPDKDVAFDVYFDEMRTLRSYCTYQTVSRFEMPTDKKDFGAMTEDDSRQWIYQTAI